MKKNHLVAFALAAAATAPAFAQDKQALYVAGLAANCAACHGTNGNAAPGTAAGALAGQSKDYITAQMKAFKAGTRPATIMHQLAKGYSDAQIEQLAAYFAAQKKQ
jgi:sulfide dehydrogenase cytochrome subunit